MWRCFYQGQTCSCQGHCHMERKAIVNLNIFICSPEIQWLISIFICILCMHDIWVFILECQLEKCTQLGPVRNIYNNLSRIWFIIFFSLFIHVYIIYQLHVNFFAFCSVRFVFEFSRVAQIFTVGKKYTLTVLG